MTVFLWVWFCLAQLLMLVLTVAGWAILILPCLFEAWKPSPYPSINDGRMIDRWSWGWMNALYGNPEDGVSGETALVWLNATTRRPFMSWANPAWRAYVWSAWRNSTDSLKYSLALGIHGPTFAVNVFGRPLRGGWSVENGLPVLVLSWKA